MTGSGPVQLLVYRFDERADFEGRLVGALERMESGGALRILEALFVGRISATGELSAVSLHSRGAGTLVAPLVGFRLDESERERATAKALSSADLGPVILEIGDKLASGEALVAVLVEHTWARALNAAVASSGGSERRAEFVQAGSLTDLAALLISEAGSTARGG